MRAVLPGKPQAKLQAVCVGQWHNQRLVAYISGSAVIILSAADAILQTIYHEEDEELEAIALDESTGKFAACTKSTVYVYKPYGKEDGALKWCLQCSFTPEDDGVSTLSWGFSEELLVGGSKLALFSMNQSQHSIWSIQLANPAKFASFSYDSSLISSTGWHDRLVKIWRRLGSGEDDDSRFDFTYLSHPTTITGMHWRRPFHRDQTIDNVLYTICADNILRIWAATDPHGLQVLQQWAQIDLEESIKPRLSDLKMASTRRFAFIIDSREFGLGTQRAVESAKDSDKQESGLEHLIEIANRSPEICVALDDEGRMSAWGLENVGCKSRKTTNLFNVAHFEGLKLHFAHGAQDELRNVQFYNFCGEGAGEKFTILAHHFDGRIEWLEADISELFDPSPRQDRLIRKAIWSGHASSIKKIVRTASGRALVSRTSDNEGLVWKQTATKHGTRIIRQSQLTVPEHIHRTCVLQEGDYVAFLHYGTVTLWDTRGHVGTQLASCSYEVEGKPLALILLPEVEQTVRIAHVATISSEMKGIVWEISLPPPSMTNGSSGLEGSSTILREFSRFDLGMKDDLAFVLPVDPAGPTTTISGFMDTFARDVAISYTNSGVLRAWTAKVDLDKEIVRWLLTSTVETGIMNPSLASGTSIRKSALVNANRTGLTIWDLRGAQLEYEDDFHAQDVIQDLDWTSTPDDQSILAVGFPHRVVLMSQLRYDYLNAGPAWAKIREIRIKEMTPHPIGDSIWLGGGNFVIGAGNQLFIYEKTVDVADKFVTDLRLPTHQRITTDLFSLVTRLNGSLPVFHPQFLAQAILSGKSVLVQRILIGLHKKLKFFSEGDELDGFVGIQTEEFYRPLEDAPNPAKKEMHSSYADFDDEEVDSFNEDLASSLNEKLTHVAIPQLSSPEQIHLADIIECVATVEKHRRSMDDNATRYLLFFRQHMLRRSQGATSQVNISWREIVWAFHSNSQDILVDLVARNFHGKMLWEHAKESGMFMWIRDLTALRNQFELIARNQYTATDEKNPIDCSLYYFALKKKNVLVGLWRMAGWNREQRSTQKLLANNFKEARWKTAALKNAYALLGKHRFEYAAAFFLLADCLKDAVNVCSNQMNDLQLAIAISRIYEGDDGPVLRELLEEKVLVEAAKEGNRWMATWAFWMLNRRDVAVRALISPVYTLLNTPETPGTQSKLFLADDPALVVLYKQLREKTLQTLKGASKISGRMEWDFIIHNARLYDRMGCDLLALDLVRNWEFLKPVSARKKSIEAAPDPRMVLRRRSSLVVDDLQSPTLNDLRSAAATKKQAPTVFEEPESSSLLDSFGF